MSEQDWLCDVELDRGSRALPSSQSCSDNDVGGSGVLEVGISNFLFSLGFLCVGLIWTPAYIHLLILFIYCVRETDFDGGVVYLPTYCKTRQTS